MKNKVTVVPIDNLIIVDGEALEFEFAKPEGVHAIQWMGDTGWVEYTDKRANKPADYNTDIAPFVALWEAEKARLKEEANRPLSPEEINAQRIAEIEHELDTLSSSPTYKRAYDEMAESLAYDTQPSQYAIDTVKSATMQKKELRAELTTLKGV